MGVDSQFICDISTDYPLAPNFLTKGKHVNNYL